MTTETTAHPQRLTRRLTRSILLLAAAALTSALPASPQMLQPSLRNLTGTITDSSHEPLRNAVVELRNGKTNEVVTYITGVTGQYTFKRLDGTTDYEVWVLFRGHHSATHNISKFDSHMAKVIDFTVRTY
jgi:hypothetical protein